MKAITRITVYHLTGNLIRPLYTFWSLVNLLTAAQIHWNEGRSLGFSAQHSVKMAYLKVPKLYFFLVFFIKNDINTTTTTTTTTTTGYFICIKDFISLYRLGSLISNYSSRPNGLWVNSPWGRRPNWPASIGPSNFLDLGRSKGLCSQGKAEWLRSHEGERNNCFSKIQLVGQKYRDKKILASLS